ncbi:hypothetical protein CPB84DRAFT_1773585 [Gymnopilus junonius]|uniref:F-box domain-containing protein n=1 Tax=Gymnopilus junonius TaxID=109634 RepID=A0A9P5NP23_GYMJU|nr:hypothetical protein CPB84DRAFT_1773585 [Gymnopilus junonius]
MKTPVAHLLRNNDPLCDTAIQEVKELLKIPLGELDEIDKQILDLQAQVKSLEERRDEIQKCVDKYHLLLSPIRRLPDDALHEIFYHCLSTHRNPIISSSEAPVLLTHVCRKWRAIALSSPRLWSQLHITFSDAYRANLRPRDLEGASEAEVKELRARARVVLHNRCTIVETWLRRSGSCPLSISVYYLGCHGRALEDIEAAVNDPDDLTNQLFRTLSLFSDRCGTLELLMPANIYCKYEPLMSAPPSAFRLLTTLRLNLYHTHIATPNNEPFPTPVPSALLSAPQVHKLTLTWWHALIRSSIDTLSSYLLSSFSEALILFKACVNMVHKSNINGQVSLPHLLSFSILEGPVNLDTSRQFYSSIDAPRLKYIKYTSENPALHNLDPDAPPPIVSLLQGASELTKLAITPRMFVPTALRKLLGTANQNLKHLVIGEEPFNKLTRRRYDPRSYFRAFDLKSRPCNPIILPRLEVFEWSPGLVPDEAVLQFITERMDPPPPSGVTSLKRVRIMFTRGQEIDILEEVNQYRDEKMRSEGVQLTDKGPNQLSSSYGLNGRNQTWGYADTY